LWVRGEAMYNQMVSWLASCENHTTTTMGRNHGKNLEKTPQQKKKEDGERRTVDPTGQVILHLGLGKGLARERK